MDLADYSINSVGIHESLSICDKDNSPFVLELFAILYNHLDGQDKGGYGLSIFISLDVMSVEKWED